MGEQEAVNGQMFADSNKKAVRCDTIVDCSLKLFATIATFHFSV